MTTVVSRDGHDISGTTANRPTNAEPGMTYFDSDIDALCCAMDDGVMRSVSGHIGVATVASAGTNQGTAAALVAGIANLVTGADGTKGVILPAMYVSDVVYVYNNSSSPLPVYPSTGKTINGGSANAAVNVPPNSLTMFLAVSSTNWAYDITSGTQGAGVFDSITGGVTPFPIAGLAAAQGGTVAIVGGTSSTAGNGGGPVTVTGGTPGATSVGGTVSIVGGAGGATSGAGGAVTMTGGAGTAGNGTGGLSRNVGGAGQGSGAGGVAGLTGGAGGATGAGGAITITSGQGGATSGAAGAINISVGSATNAAGASITLTAGNGATGTNGGGNINLVPGTAVSTGTPGEVQANGNSQWIFVSEPLTATDVTRTLLVATRPMRLKATSVVFSTASSSGTVQLEKCTGTTAPGAGTTLLSGTVSLSGTANTVANGTLIATVASLTFATGDRLGMVIAGTMTNLVGCRLSVALAPV